MNKQDVLIILEAIASDDYFKDYQIRKSDDSIIYKSVNGYKRVRLVYHNSFDLERKDLALEIQPHYEVRFNVLHKWFEKYSKRELKYQRDDDSVQALQFEVIVADTVLCGLSTVDKQFKARDIEHLRRTASRPDGQCSTASEYGEKDVHSELRIKS